MALELLKGLEEHRDGTSIAAFFRGLHEDIESDRKELEQLMRELAIGESTARKATAWVAEKLTELKLRIEDPDGGDLRLLESLELVSLGIEGKRLLWLALRKAAEQSPALRQLDYDRLIDRAAEQRAAVEEERLQVAASVLARNGEQETDAGGRSG
jgi:hypothetical protein